VTTTISGKGVFPEDHPLFLWNGFGASAPPFVRSVMERCDCLLAVGCRFGEVATASYGLEPPANLIHVDIDRAVLGRNYPAALAVESDAAPFLAALAGQLAARPRDAALESAIAAGHREVRATALARAGAARVAPAALFATLQELAGADAVYATDSGNGTFLAMEHLRLTRPGCFLAPVDYSCMGYSVPAAIGAALAYPGRDVVALAGDGALLMTGLELLTAAAYGVGLVVCVLRDGELAQIAQFQRTTLNRDTCSVLHPYSVEAFARATNCDYLALADDRGARDVLADALGRSRSGRPVVVEVAIDYSQKTFFTKGVVTTNFWRLPWGDRLRLLGRAVARRLPGG
jgi:acetolactate synthase-1/2/3 large subunit